MMTIKDLLYSMLAWMQRVYNRLWLRYMELESERRRRNPSSGRRE